MRNLLLLILALLPLSAFAQSYTQTISMGEGITNQVFLNLPDGAEYSAPINNWDIAIEINGGFSASLLINEGNGTKLYGVNDMVMDQWDELNSTDNLESWEELRNSNTTWSEGAFSRHLTFDYDLGWGIYDFTTHVVTGDSLYVIQLADQSYKKIKIESLNGGVYTFTYAAMDGSNSQTVEINKDDYAGVNFAYYSLQNNEAINREPASEAWDLTFTKYESFISPPGAYYPVTGVLSNKYIAIEEIEDDNIADYVYEGNPSDEDISIIGYDWKIYNQAEMAYELATNRAYFVKDLLNGEVYKLSLTSFGGSQTGTIDIEVDYLFTTTVALEEINLLGDVAVYPNPTKDILNVNFTSEEIDNYTIRIADMSGRNLIEQNYSANMDLNQTQLDVSDLTEGLYLLHIASDKGQWQQTWVKK